MEMLRILAIGFFFTIGVELAIGLCMAFKTASKEVNKK